MSKACRSILVYFTGLLLFLLAFGAVRAQDIEVTVRPDSDRSLVHIQWRERPMRDERSPLTFLSSYAGIGLPNERIVNVRRDRDWWSYDVDLTPPKARTAGAHISWLTTEGGILMLGDLLPQPTSGRSVHIMLNRGDDLEYEVMAFANAANAVLILGKNWKQEQIVTGTAMLGTQLLGQWQFGDADFGSLAAEIFGHQAGTFGSLPAGKHYQIALAKLPAVANGVWEGDTRGTNVTIVSSDMPFKSQSLQRLHEQLRHEMFHLWIPEGVNLTGNYDWFYEGFALYQSLKLGVAVNRLRFDDYLDSLSQAYAIDQRLWGKLSLTDSSKTRWSGDNNSIIYARGMLVAFLCDLAMLKASKGKRSTDDIVREVYQKHSGKAAPQDGTAAVMAIMKQRPELAPIVDHYVTGKEKLDWTPFLNAAGLDSSGRVLTVTAKPNGRQKKLLDKLGYNNWRKLSTTRK